MFRIGNVPFFLGTSFILRCCTICMWCAESLDSSELSTMVHISWSKADRGRGGKTIKEWTGLEFCKVPEGSGEQRKMEETFCEVICGTQTIPAVKRQVRTKEGQMQTNCLGIKVLTDTADIDRQFS